MNLKLCLLSVCFFVNFIVSSYSVLYDDTSELSWKDEFNLHHAFVIEKYKWASGLIRFKIDVNFNFTEIYLIISAMYQIERSSCIRFVAHNPSYGPNYVMIRKDFNAGGCGEAHTGCRNIGEQTLTLSSECIDVVLHELLHTIGFYHHHMRSDRDKYITLHRENTNSTDNAFSDNFEKRIEYDERIKYLTPFDYKSVMLYDAYQFSYYSSDLPVLSSIIEGEKIQPFVYRLSEYDEVLLNRFYDCESVDKKKSVIFYETEFGMSSPPVINYHEIERAYSGVKVEHVFVDDKIAEDHKKAAVEDAIESEKENFVIDDEKEVT